MAGMGGGDVAFDLAGGQGGESGENGVQELEGIEAVGAVGLDEGVEDGAALAGLASPMKSQFFLPMAVGRMAFSTGLLSMWMQPSLR